MTKKIVCIALSVISLIALLFTAGCQTAEGFGRDLQGLGERIEDRAR